MNSLRFSDSKDIVITNDEIMGAVQGMADYYNHLYHDTEEITAIAVLNGAVPFASALTPLLRPKVIEGEMKVSSMSGTESTGELEFKKPPNVDTRGRHLLIIEDLVDTGLTMSGLYRYFIEQGQAESVQFAALFEKPDSRKPDTEITNLTTGIKIASKYIIGFGMDWDGRYRKLDYVTYVEKSESGEQRIVYSKPRKRRSKTS